MVLPRHPLVPFLLVSLGLHLSLLLAWPDRGGDQPALEKIPVSLVPPTEETKPEPSSPAREERARPVKAPAGQVSKRSPAPPQMAARRIPDLPIGEEKREPRSQPRQREKISIVQRPLPTLKDLLPPVTWVPSQERPPGDEGAVRLDTKEPKYVSYFTSIKLAIESVWEYPEPALRQGMQGKLLLEFTILGNGQLEKTRLIRSSGFSILDQEALRAVQAASPFHQIPPSIGKSRLDIVASFEYHDNRVRYGVVP
ncbi:MAG: energy transducer TonB [Deltaproteobacteria bacterium]|nr:energy transducer TonB [Deltaproteobacteria bacterium]MBI2540446.1 energy transducer TonB [Deltaproteobacteria bacterium]